MEDYRIFRYRRAVFLIALICLWFGVLYHLWLQAFYQLAPEPVKVFAKDKQSRTFLNSATYTLFYRDDGELKPVNTSRSEYLILKKGDTFCYSYNSFFGQKFNYRQRSCGQTDGYHPIMKLLDLFKDN
ncbi:hypothetical protein HRE53_30995 (plasmid) [Acaryochloris sp. 'Moss Beach']|uniref:hypothetical protein n=1 Tax=Acaryochloris sp. 'Moss Beach' TaxID=2740837 RepID=UPI001F1E90F3|nr:hypothetical protein [Acaryochloris sp. 'Moss Beach']UJB73137.1 hypothetical protein HRE53_30995 [Acaryochloris sp. 'Moss Beach']